MNRKLFTLGLAAVVCFISSVLIAGGINIQQSGLKTVAAHPISTEVRNTSGEDLSLGDVVVWQTNASLSATTYPDGLQYAVDITTPVNQGQVPVAGVLLEDIKDGNYGEMALRGYVADINVNMGNITIGQVLIATSTILGSTVADHASSTAGSYNMGDEGGFAIALETTTGESSTTIKGYLYR